MGTSCFRPRCARASGSTQRRASVLKRRKEKGTQSPKVRGCLDALWGHDGTGRSPEQRGLSGKAARWEHPCRRYSLFPTSIETRSPTQKKTLRAEGPKAQRDSSSRLCLARHKRDPQHVRSSCHTPGAGMKGQTRCRARHRGVHSPGTGPARTLVSESSCEHGGCLGSLCRAGPSSLSRWRSPSPPSSRSLIPTHTSGARHGPPTSLADPFPPFRLSSDLTFPKAFSAQPPLSPCPCACSVP